MTARRPTEYGVKTGPNALCFWQVDEEGVSLTLDVRSGGRRRASRRAVAWTAATVVMREGADGETPFAAARAFCRLLCDSPLLPKQPVYGGNNWYYAYGNSSHEQILDDARLMASVAPGRRQSPVHGD